MKVMEKKTWRDKCGQCPWKHCSGERISYKPDGYKNLLGRYIMEMEISLYLSLMPFKIIVIYNQLPCSNPMLLFIRQLLISFPNTILYEDNILPDINI